MSTNPGAVYLMYHELELPGRPMCRDEAGYVRYVVTEADFRAQMQDLRARGRRGMSVGEALVSPSASGVALTFDDGCETDLIAAAPLLKEMSFNATFYITVGFLDRRGYLSRSQLRELPALGFEIGSHSVTHRYLTDVNESSLRDEIEGSKKKLEEIVNRPVVHFSCPGGRFDPRAVAVARDSGYLSFATSETRVNTAATSRYALGRVAILRGMPLPEFQEISEGQGLWKRRARQSARTFVRNVIGNSLYDQLRAQLLRRHSDK